MIVYSIDKINSHMDFNILESQQLFQFRKNAYFSR